MLKFEYNIITGLSYYYEPVKMYRNTRKSKKKRPNPKFSTKRTI